MVVVVHQFVYVMYQMDNEYISNNCIARLLYICIYRGEPEVIRTFQYLMNVDWIALI